MNLDLLREEVDVELEAMEVVVREILSLRQDVGQKEPTIRELTAAAAFLAQFYSGIENILKRVTVYNDVQLPVGETWHIELFQLFSKPHRVLAYWPTTIPRERAVPQVTVKSAGEWIS